jgi:hypothetical protein
MANTGAMSDKELQAYENSVPNLLMSEDGNKRLVAFMKDAIDRGKQYHENKRKWFEWKKSQNQHGVGSFDGFQEWWDETAKPALGPPKWMTPEAQ